MFVLNGVSGWSSVSVCVTRVAGRYKPSPHIFYSLFHEDSLDSRLSLEKLLASFTISIFGQEELKTCFSHAKVGTRISNFCYELAMSRAVSIWYHLQALCSAVPSLSSRIWVKIDRDWLFRGYFRVKFLKTDTGTRAGAGDSSWVCMRRASSRKVAVPMRDYTDCFPLIDRPHMRFLNLQPHHHINPATNVSSIFADNTN